MASRLALRVLGVVVCVSMFGLVPSAQAGQKKTTTSGIPCRINVFNEVVDEQNTTAFYNDGSEYCSGQYDETTRPQISAVNGENPISTPAYGFGAPWLLWTTAVSTSYANGDNCSSANTCLQATLDSGSKVLTLDTRSTSGPRQLHIDFSHPCIEAQWCPGVAGDPAVFGGNLGTTGLLNVFLEYPFTSVAACSSTVCPEVRSGYAKFWFTDPADPSVTWRIDWNDVRVLRMNADTWYLIANECDGTQIAGLSKLIGNRTRPRTVFNGYYKIPFFITATTAVQ